jgi:CheY-like chemotaxis protein
MKKILIVENDFSILLLLSQLLELEGFQVLLADNGAKGAEMLSLHPDLVLCDLVMPELDGYGVLHKLQSNPETLAIPFIFLTASASEEERQKCLDQGATGFMVKPFHQQELLSLIYSFLPGHYRV